VVIFEVDNPATGTTSPSPGTYRFGEADTLFFGTHAHSGYHFDRWELTYINDGAREVDTLGAEYANGYYVPVATWIALDTVVFRAYFEVGRPDSTTATYTVNNPAMGTTIPAPGTYSIYVGDSVVAAARAFAGYELAYWTLATYRQGSLVTEDTFAADNPVYFGVLPQGYADYGASIVITAFFQPGDVNQYTVTLQTADSTMGTVDPSGGTAVNEGDVFLATARPRPGYRFVAWMMDSVQVSTANPYSFTVTADVTLTALFEADPTGIGDVEPAGFTIVMAEGRITVKGAGNQEVCVYDASGRLVGRKSLADGTVAFAVPATGVYLVRVGSAPAKRVVVVR